MTGSGPRRHGGDRPGPAAAARAPATTSASTRGAWMPRQHGAWAMLLLPLLLGVAASRPSGWQVVLAAAAVSGYLLSATLQAWARGRRKPVYRPPIAVYGTTFAILGIILAISFPALLLTGLVVVPAGVVVAGGARPGTRRDLANSLAQVAQALVLVPATAFVAGGAGTGHVVAYSLVAAAYLVGSVLVVRSVLRERGNDRFAALSIGFHVLLVAIAALALSPWYAVVAAWLAARAVALPLVQRRWAGGPHQLRPLQVGVVEIISSLAVVVVAFAWAL